MITVNTLGHSAEAFLFIYLGLGIYTIDQRSFSLGFCMLILVGGLFARAAAVFIPIGIYACIKKCKITINFK